MGSISLFGLEEETLASSLWEVTQMSSHLSTIINSEDRSQAGVWGMGRRGKRCCLFGNDGEHEENKSLKPKGLKRREVHFRWECRS